MHFIGKRSNNKGEKTNDEVPVLTEDEADRLLEAFMQECDTGETLVIEEVYENLEGGTKK